MKKLIVIGVVTFLSVAGIAMSKQNWHDGIVEASYYTVASCKREGTSGIMANGAPLDDKALTFACWMLPFKTRVQFQNVSNNKTVIAVCSDRGPSRKLVRDKNRMFDLSLAAFEAIGNTRSGVIDVRWRIIE